MKKIILSVAVIALASSISMAQEKKQEVKIAPAQKEVAAPAAQHPEFMKFKEEVHDFGTIPQGTPVTTSFEFKNTGKEPIVLQNVRASCGCTTPQWPKEPILPGKTGVIKATYNAAAAAPFTKTVTVTSNIGTKMLTIKGKVEAKPATSVPQNNSSVKTN
jgi:hypothetical protein